MRVALIHGNDGSDVRVGKTCRSLCRLGHEVHFIGWDRRPGQPKRLDLGTTHLHVMPLATRHGRATLRGQWRFFRHAASVLDRVRPRTLCCVNEDTALGLLPYRGRLYERLICDVFDALADRHSHQPWPLYWGARVAAEIVRGAADALIATDAARHARFGRHGRKCTVIENVPEDPGEAMSLRLPAGPVKVYVAGSLSLGRGIRQILQAVEPLEDMEIVSAGWAYDDFAAGAFLAHPKVTHHGVVTARESLDLAAGCDAVLCFYTPATVNNLHASPNKIHDALSVGRPVLVNEEIHVARWVAEHRVGWSCGYEDVAALRQLVAGLRARRAELGAFARRARALFLSGPTWARMEPRLARLYDPP